MGANTIGIIGAMQLEIESLLADMTIRQSLTIADMKFYVGTLMEEPVVIVRSGVGKVNAAMCAQILCTAFHVSHIVNTGVAGALNPNLHIGDILVSTDALEHDMNVSALGYEPGIVPQMDASIWEADLDMVNAATAAAEEALPDATVLTGRVLSGDQFIASASDKERLARFGGDCAEMEGAAIAHAAYLNHIPFVVIRAISDQADGSACEDYPSFERKAALRSAKLVEALICRI